MLVAMVGIDAQEGVPRYAFGELYLWAGIPLVPLVVGLFGGTELLQLMLSRRSISRADAEAATAGASSASGDLSGVGHGVRDSFAHWIEFLPGDATARAVDSLLHSDAAFQTALREIT